MIELRLNEGFAAESGPEVILGRGRESPEQNRFDHHLTRQVQMSPAIDRAHPAMRQLARDLVIADDFTDHCKLPGAVETGRYRSRLCTATWNLVGANSRRCAFYSRGAFLRRPDNITAPPPGTPPAKCRRSVWRCVSVRRCPWLTRRSHKDRKS